MKPGLCVGSQATMEFYVTPDMTVQFGSRALHPFYATYWVAHHAEHCSRLLLEPFLELNEDGIGSGLTIRHHSPALSGQHLTCIATATRVRSHHLVNSYEIRHGDRLIADGEMHQVIVPKSKLAEIHQHATTSLPPVSGG